MKAMVEVTTEESARRAASRLRDIDRESIESFGLNPADSIVNNVANSHYCLTGTVAGEVVCVWGVMATSLMSDKGLLWMVTTKDLDNNAFVFIRKSQIELEKIFKLYEELYGFVAVENKRSKRWLTWMGFEFSSTPVDFFGKPAWKFWKRRK